MAPVLSHVEIGDVLAPRAERDDHYTTTGAVLLAAAALTFATIAATSFDDPYAAAIEQQQTQAALTAALAKLNPDDRALLEEIYLEGSTYEAAAQRRSAAKASVHRRVQAVLEQLGQELRPVRE
jgi:DNA-directed RNA polymerase specialized sigma24 family protein